MADFYPVLTDAVARLPHNDARARQNLYARARAIFAERSRERGTQELASALEAAIGRVEAEAQAKATAKSLTRILEVLQSDAPSADASLVSGRAPRADASLVSGPAPNTAAAASTAKAPPNRIDADNPRPADAAAELGGMPNSLGMMLLGIAYAVAAIAFTGVAGIRGAVWASEGLIGYPAMLAMMTITLALFVVPPLLMFRKISNLPTIGLLLRFIHSASRRSSA